MLVDQLSTSTTLALALVADGSPTSNMSRVCWSVWSLAISCMTHQLTHKCFVVGLTLPKAKGFTARLRRWANIETALGEFVHTYARTLQH